MDNEKLTFEKHRYWIDSGFDLDYRRIYLACDIDETLVSDVARAIDLLNDLSDEPIHIYMSSFGGEVYTCLALYDVIRGSDCEVHTHCRGMAMSAGLVLFLAGDVRHAGPNTTFMAHSVSGGSIGKTRDMEVDVDETKRLNTLLARILADRTSRGLTWWRDRIKHEDFFFDVKEAKKLGVLTDE